MSANFKIAAPVAGATPQTSVRYSGTKDNKTETICTGSIVWYDAATGAVAELDSKGEMRYKTIKNSPIPEINSE